MSQKLPRAQRRRENLVGFGIDREIRAVIEQQARAEHRTMSAQFRYLIDLALRVQQQQQDSKAA